MAGRAAAADRQLAAARRNSRMAGSAKTGDTGQDDKRLRKVCTEMESLFVKQLLTSMRKTIQKSGFIDGGSAEEIFTDMLDSKYAMKMASSRSLGLAEMLYSQLSRGKKW